MSKNVMMVVIAAAAVAMCSHATRDASTSSAVAAPAKAAPTDREIEIQREAVAHLMGSGSLANAHWGDGDLILVASENGQSWQPVADRACSWVRGKGYSPQFSVQVVEASALRNKRWQQLARARCA